jgi:very-short-patch-repair endonuclease
MADQKHEPKSPVSEKRRSNARAVRREITEAKRITCYNVRAHRFRGVSFPRQIPAGPYVVDSICHAAKLIVEVDGSQHFEPKTIVRDAPRDAYPTAQDCGVVRFNSLDVMKNRAGLLEQISSQPPSLTLSRKRGRGAGRAGREDVP